MRLSKMRTIWIVLTSCFMLLASTFAYANTHLDKPLSNHLVSSEAKISCNSGQHHHMVVDHVSANVVSEACSTVQDHHQTCCDISCSVTNIAVFNQTYYAVVQTTAHLARSYEWLPSVFNYPSSLYRPPIA